jgi:hypothetical protein
MKKRYWLMTAVLFISAIALPAKSIQSLQYISPVPGSEFNSRESTIILRPEEQSQVQQLLHPGVVRLTGSVSGNITGELILSSDKKTVILKPKQKFAPGEMINVEIVPETDMMLKGKHAISGTFDFKIAPFSQTPNPYEYIRELRPNYHSKSLSLHKTSNDTLPPDFPPLNVDVYDTTRVGEGYIFMAVASEVEGIGYYLMMLNNDGSPFYYKKLTRDYAYDFKMQPNGFLTYAQFLEHHSYTGGGNVIHMIMDSSFTVIDSVQMGNGYVAEAHDFQILPNGHYLLFGYYLTQVDMSQYVDGGHPAAYVSGGVVQELDMYKNVVFQWRTWDHYDFSEYTWGRRSSRQYVSAFHLNTINLDTDGHIFIATPRWAKKLNRQTGEIIWHLGGDENEFSFVGVDSAEGVGYVGGHTFHRIDNGNVLVHDNAGRRGKSTSKVHEFKLDEENKIAELVWSYIPETDIAGWHRGSAQRLPNGNTVIGWGGSSGKPSPAFTEVNAAGEIVHQISFVPPSIESYRAFRFPFDGGKPCADVVITEIAQGNDYAFKEEGNDTGIEIEINNMTGDGYNEIRVQKYNTAPVYTQFFDKAPRVHTQRATIEPYAIQSINMTVQFDIKKYNLPDPANTTVYVRDNVGEGLFISLPTTYNPVTGRLVATSVKFGEFIFATPALESLLYPPHLFAPTDSGFVNQNLPLELRWTPVGYVNKYALQVSKDSAFDTLFVDQRPLWEARFTLNELDLNTTYYWRVKSINNAGESEWSDVNIFTTEPPFLELTAPKDGDTWQRGLDYYIKWNDNIEEKVIIELYKNGTLMGLVDTTASNGAYEWSIDPGLATGSDYEIKIESLTDETLFATNPFAVIDTVTSVQSKPQPVNDYVLHQNYPNPFNPVTEIEFELQKAGMVTLKIFDILGKELETLLYARKAAGSHKILFNGKHYPSGVYFYQIKSNGFSEMKKMILMK